MMKNKEISNSSSDKSQESPPNIEFDDLDSDEMQQMTGFFRPKKFKDPIRAMKRTEPEGEIIKKIDGPTVYQRIFFDNYIDESDQAWNSKQCSKCDRIFKSACDTRRHFISHFHKDDYEKYRCLRCFKNYDDWGNLNKHGEQGRCVLIENEYPHASVFISKVLEEHKMERSKKCTNCQKDFRYLSLFDEHLFSCLRLTYPCQKCPKSFVDYKRARIHNQSCDGSGMSGNKYIFFKKDEVTPPKPELKTIKWTEAKMMDMIRLEAVPQLRKLFERFPKPTYGSFGMTSNVKTRFSQYRDYWQFYKSSECKPFMDFDESILFRCWSKFDALLCEYLLQKHTIQHDGEFYKEFGTNMNPQAVLKPVRREKNMVEKEHYVYFRASKVPFTFSNKFKDLKPDSDDECDILRKKSRIEEPCTSKAINPVLPSTSEAVCRRLSEFDKNLYEKPTEIQEGVAKELPSPTLWEGHQPFWPLDDKSLEESSD